MFLTVAPVHAAGSTNTSDTLTRLKISTSATHTLTGTFGTAIPDFGIVAFDYNTASFTLTPSSPSCSFASGTCTASVSATGVDVTCTQTDGTCSGVLTLGTFTGTNPSSAGSKLITLSGSGGYTNTFSIAIMDDDQVTITATVAPSITFDIDIQSSCGSESAAPYSVSLGTLTTTSVTTATNHICLELDTNASGGAVVTVQGSGSADALESAASGDSIGTTYSGSSALLAAGTEGYGICVASTSAVTGSATAVAPYNADCTADNVGGVDSAAPQNLLNTASAPLDGTANDTADIVVRAAIASTTAAANDYTDVLTFIATGTF